MSHVIKVADFGLTEEVYARNYFRQMDTLERSGEGPVKLPVKWMALESLNDGVFSEKSDVVGNNNFIHKERYLYCLLYCAVVIWSDMLGGVLIGKEPLPWSGRLLSHQIFGQRRAT